MAADELLVKGVTRVRAGDVPPGLKPLKRLVNLVLGHAPNATDSEVAEAVAALWPTACKPAAEPAKPASSSVVTSAQKARDAARKAERDRMKSRRRG